MNLAPFFSVAAFCPEIILIAYYWSYHCYRVQLKMHINFTTCLCSIASLCKESCSSYGMDSVKSEARPLLYKPNQDVAAIITEWTAQNQKPVHSYLVERRCSNSYRMDSIKPEGRPLVQIKSLCCNQNSEWIYTYYICSI